MTPTDLQQSKPKSLIPRILRKGLEFEFTEILDHVSKKQLKPGDLRLVHCDQVLDFSALIKCAENHGYFSSGLCYEEPPHVVITNGSVKCHTDSEDYGITVGCLLRDDENAHFSAELITQYGALELQVGDVFIFDSCLWHGWIADGLCLLAMISVCDKEGKEVQ